MSECESSTEEIMIAIISQCGPTPAQIKQRKKSMLFSEAMDELRKYDKERKKRYRQQLSGEERKLFLERERLNRKENRLQPSFDKTRAREAERKRNIRSSMTAEELEVFRAKDAQRKRIARLNKKMELESSANDQSSSSENCARTILMPTTDLVCKKTQVLKSKRLTDNALRKQESHSNMTQEQLEDLHTEYAQRMRTARLEQNSYLGAATDHRTSCDSSKERHCHDHTSNSGVSEYNGLETHVDDDERIKELEAVLTDLLDVQEEKVIGKSNSVLNHQGKNVCLKVTCSDGDDSRHDRIQQLEAQIWELIDEMENEEKHS